MASAGNQSQKTIVVDFQLMDKDIVKNVQSLQQNEMKRVFAEIDEVTPQNVRTLYSAMEELGIPFKKTVCKRCRHDYLMIVKEELGLIADASEHSAFDGEACYRYVVDKPVFWNGWKIDSETPQEIVKKFVERFPKGYFVPCNDGE